MTFEQYKRQIKGLQIMCKQLFDKDLSVQDCIQLMETPEGQQLIARLESLPPMPRTTKTITFPLA